MDKLAFLRHYFCQVFLSMEKKKIQPLFLENLILTFAGYKIKRFAHHKHSEQSDQITPHKHVHSQFLLYLRGRGIQITGLNKQPVMRGSFLYFPPQTLHGFIKSMESLPLLVFDFNEKNPLSPETSLQKSGPGRFVRNRADPSSHY